MAFDGSLLNKIGRGYSVEASTLQIRYVPHNEPIKIENLEGKTREFKLVKVDRDASNEDVYGWRLEEIVAEGKGLELLIVND